MCWCLATLRKAAAAAALQALCADSLLLLPLHQPPLQWGLASHWGHTLSSTTLLAEALTAVR